MAACRRSSGKRWPKIRAPLIGHADKLDLPDDPFDWAYCRFLLKHVPSPIDVAGETAPVTKPGGWLCTFEWENGCSVIYPESPAVERL